MKKYIISLVGLVFYLILAGGSVEDTVSDLVEKETQKIMDEAEKETQKIMDDINNSYKPPKYNRSASSSKKSTSINGTYSLDAGDGELTITISGNSWRSKFVMVTGFGSAYDNQNAEYDRGIVKGNDLFDKSGYVNVGYVSGPGGTLRFGNYTLSK
tara:strand:+ start:150 stop:617 length:468 start_codon:yes stop_codon:yes gene_type:complete